ncbi:MAG TPA: SDR family oxidoreductase [Terriglobia bacterium]|nr:SDR family oxidoreductase [Terriglobia bacterium]
MKVADKSKDSTLFQVDGVLLPDSPLPLAFHFARNAQAFSERVYRLAGVGLAAFLRPILSLASRRLATRLLYIPLRGMSRDRLDLLGEEYFQYVLRPLIDPLGAGQIQACLESRRHVVLVSQQLDHVIRPLTCFLRVESLLTNRLEYRDDLATGRLLDPVIPPLKPPKTSSPRGQISREEPSNIRGLLDWEWLKTCLVLDAGRLNPDGYVVSTSRPLRTRRYPVVDFRKQRAQLQPFSVRQAFSGKQLLLVGSTGFIGKVWLAILLQDLSEIRKIYLLIRRQGARSAIQRFEKIVAESPVFKILHERHGERLGDYLGERLEILEGDVGEPQLGLDDKTAEPLYANLDLIVNSAGLTDFNPDLRLALSTNVESVQNLTEFLRKSDHAGLVHVSTCFVNGRTEGRVPEELTPNYTPRGDSRFDIIDEWNYLHEAIDRLTREAESPEMSAQFKQESMARHRQGDDPVADERSVQGLIRKVRTRWLRDQLIELGIERARRWGWPNIYTYTKSLGESLLQLKGRDLPIAVVRPSIVESSISQPFRGWNEGVNTTAPLSYLLGTYFRQLPSNKRKRLDVIPVDYVCRGLTLVSAAVLRRCHNRVYQLATSANNPADMRRAIELTCLAHRKHYRSLEGLEHWLRARCDTIPVSKTRYESVSLPRFQALLEGLRRMLTFLPPVEEAVARKRRVIDRYQKVIELYKPFILDNEFFFAADNIKVLSHAIPDNEVTTFGYDTDTIDWYDYWINLHVPALRRWTYPLIEGRRPEAGLLPRNFKMPVQPKKSSNLQTLLQEFKPGRDVASNDATEIPQPAQPSGD